MARIACAVPWRCLLPLCVLALVPVVDAQVEPLQVRAGVQSQRVYVGQQFLLQIQVQGTDQPDPIDIRPVEEDFVVTEAGGGASNSTSVSIVNGQMTRQVMRGYNFNYRLAARRVGESIIPSITVTAAGQSARTVPVRMQVLPPEENDDFHLRLSLSETSAYVGQPVILTLVWYIGQEVQDFSFTVPILDDRRFEIIDPPSPAVAGQGQPDQMEIRLEDRRAIATRGVGELEGRRFTVLRLSKILIPREAGSATLPAATVTFVTSRPDSTRRRDPFDDFFGGSFFSGAFGGRRELQTLAIPSNRPVLEILELPVTNRPANFNGWIGEFDLTVEAKPTAIAVGEPITLSIAVRGTGILETARFPALDQDVRLTRDFNVPSEIGVGEGSGDRKLFTHTLRARHDRVAEIPPIRLPYFNPASGEYRTATSEAIPIMVEASRIVTAQDAEGLGTLGPRQLEVESREQGIAHNYVDTSALEPMPQGWTAPLRPLGPLPIALALLLVPPLMLLGWVAAASGLSVLEPSWLLSRGHRARWKRVAESIDATRQEGPEVTKAVLSGLRDYLGAKLGVGGSGAAAWTYGDLEKHLQNLDAHGRDTPLASDLLEDLRAVFERCEAGSYSGLAPTSVEDKRRLISEATAVVDRIEGSWR